MATLTTAVPDSEGVELRTLTLWNIFVTTHPVGNDSFRARVLIVTGTAILALVALYFLHLIIDILLVFFAGVLFGILLDGGVRLIRRFFPCARGWALLLLFVVSTALLTSLGMIVGPLVADQLAQLGEQLPRAFERVRERLMEYPWLNRAWARMPSAENAVDMSLLGQLTGMFSSALAAIVNTAIVLFVGTYLAASPPMYIKPVVSLLPQKRRERAHEVLSVAGRALRLWLLGRFVSMSAVGLLTGIGLAVLDVPLAMPLGLIAGLLSFIPFLGPLLSFVPAILIGFANGPQTALYVAAVFAAVQVVESYLIEPLVERKSVRIPPAYQITVQLISALLAGFLGVLLATPLLVIATVLVQMLYLEDVLHDHPPVVGRAPG